MIKSLRPTRVSVGRYMAALVAGAMPLSLLVLAPTAQAATVVGNLKLLPTTGNQSQILSVDTMVPCPASSKNIRVEIYGTGIDPAVQNVMMANASLASTPANNSFGGYTLPLSDPFFSIFQANSILKPSGIYTLKALCLDESAFTVEAEITGSVLFTPTTGNFNATYVQQSNAAATTTTLVADPVDPIVAGTVSTLTANVTPTDVAGSVQFRRGSTNFGSPVAVVAGEAEFTGAVPAGAGSLTARFTPANLDAYAPSTSSPLDYVVVGTASVTGTVRVGATVTCSIASAGTITYAWKANGVTVPFVTTRSFVLPASYYNQPIGCVATVTKNLTAIEQVSPTLKVAIGAALKATTAPKLKGKPKVGKKLKCKHGSWSPQPTTYRYQWLRKGKAIGKATKSRYKLTKKDSGKKIRCRVTVSLTGYTSGVDTTTAKKVK